MFGNKPQAEKQEDRLNEFIQTHNINDLDANDYENVKKIVLDLLGINVQKTSLAFSGKPEEFTKVSYLSALVEQNWIIINQLNRLSKSINKVIEK